jgi:hypothetical protein
MKIEKLEPVVAPSLLYWIWFGVSLAISIVTL